MPLSPTENDRFLAVTAGEDGTFITGWTSTGGDSSMALVKLDDSGAKDASFGQGGVATVNVAAGGKVAEVSRAVVVQEDGKILIAGPAEKNPKATGDAAKDNDVVVVRFDATGKPDPSFGTGGIARLDLGAGKPTPDGGYITDNSWGMVVLDTGRIVVFGSTPAAGRNDTDAVLAALTPAGKPDEAFGTKGVVRFDQPPTLDNARALKLDSEGRLVGTGYSRDTRRRDHPVPGPGLGRRCPRRQLRCRRAGPPRPTCCPAASPSRTPSGSWTTASCWSGTATVRAKRRWT